MRRALAPLLTPRPSSPLPALPAGLQRKQDNMRHLVSIAEARETEAKRQIADLMQQRADMLENGSGQDSSTIAADVKQLKLKIEEAQHVLELVR